MVFKKGSKILIMESGSYKVIGGAAKDTAEMYIALRKDGYDVDILGAHHKIYPNIKNITIEEALKKSYDFIWLNSIRDVIIASKYLGMHSVKPKVIYTDRGNVLLNISSASFKIMLPKNLARYYLFMKMQKWLDYYVAISYNQYEYAKKYFKNDKTKVVYILIAPRPEYFFQETKKDYHGALAVSRLDERQKRLSFMIKGVAEVVRSHPELQGKPILKIVGEGRDAENYKSLAAKLGVSSNIRFLGFQDSKQLLHLYNNAGFFVSTSEWEGLSRTFLEAMACRLPLLINDRINTTIRSNPEVKLVKDGYNGFVYRYKDLADFSQKFYKLYSDTKLQDRMGAANLKFRKQFSFENIVKNYEKIFATKA
ncbi:MAG: glycosyltransferase family 4 protein [Candidatus Micrarchaeia archaeon]